MIEILSPYQSQTKLVKKILFAIENGTEVAWLLDPDEELIFIYLVKNIFLVKLYQKIKFLYF
jgi:Uma2 family endonuclease